MIIILQILFLTFAGPAIRVVQWGLDPISWGLCIVVGAIGLIWSVILKLIPLERWLPGGGSKELPLSELNKMSTMTFRKRHDSKFFKMHSGMIRTSSVIEDRKI